MKLRLALPLSLAAAVMALTACSGSESAEGDAPESAPASSAPASSEAPASSDAPASSEGGSGVTAAQLTIDGKEVELAGEPTCTSAAGKVSMTYADGSLSVVITDGDSPKVDALSYTNTSDGTSLAYVPGMGGEVKIARESDGWVVEGKASMMSKSGAKETPFKLNFSC